MRYDVLTPLGHEVVVADSFEADGLGGLVFSITGKPVAWFPIHATARVIQAAAAATVELVKE